MAQRLALHHEPLAALHDAAQLQLPLGGRDAVPQESTPRPRGRSSSAGRAPSGGSGGGSGGSKAARSGSNGRSGSASRANRGPAGAAAPAPIWAVPRDVLRTIAAAEGIFQPCAECFDLHRGSRDSHLSFIDVDDPCGRRYCHFCKPTDATRRLVQIRRNTYSDVMRMTDLTKLCDVTGIQQYTINNGKVVFLQPRPQVPKPNAAVPSCCFCHRTLMDACCEFCSLGCKLNVEEGQEPLTIDQVLEMGDGKQIKIPRRVGPSPTQPPHAVGASGRGEGRSPPGLATACVGPPGGLGGQQPQQQAQQRMRQPAWPSSGKGGSPSAGSGEAEAEAEGEGEWEEDGGGAGYYYAGVQPAAGAFGARGAVDPPASVALLQPEGGRRSGGSGSGGGLRGSPFALVSNEGGSTQRWEALDGVAYSLLGAGGASAHEEAAGGRGAHAPLGPAGMGAVEGGGGGGGVTRAPGAAPPTRGTHGAHGGLVRGGSAPLAGLDQLGVLNPPPPSQLPLMGPPRPRLQQLLQQQVLLHQQQQQQEQQHLRQHQQAGARFGSSQAADVTMLDPHAPPGYNGYPTAGAAALPGSPAHAVPPPVPLQLQLPLPQRPPLGPRPGAGQMPRSAGGPPRATRRLSAGPMPSSYPLAGTAGAGSGDAEGGDGCADVGGLGGGVSVVGVAAAAPGALVRGAAAGHTPGGGSAAGAWAPQLARSQAPAARIDSAGGLAGAGQGSSQGGSGGRLGLKRRSASLDLAGLALGVQQQGGSLGAGDLRAGWLARGEEGEVTSPLRRGPAVAAAVGSAEAEQLAQHLALLSPTRLRRHGGGTPAEALGSGGVGGLGGGGGARVGAQRSSSLGQLLPYLRGSASGGGGGGGGGDVAAGGVHGSGAACAAVHGGDDASGGTRRVKSRKGVPQQSRLS